MPSLSADTQPLFLIYSQLPTNELVGLQLKIMEKKLNFGAGKDIKEGWDNADYDNHNGANINFDFNVFPYPINNNIYDYILACHVLEHLKEPEKTIHEFSRILKSNGIMEINVPHFNSEGAFCLGHINFWNETSFLHLDNEKLEEGDRWQKEVPYKLKVISLVCTSSRIGKFIPTYWLRRKVSLLVRGIYMEIKCKLKVIKKEENKNGKIS